MSEPERDATEPFTDEHEPVMDATEPFTDDHEPIMDATKPFTDTKRKMRERKQRKRSGKGRKCVFRHARPNLGTHCPREQHALQPVPTP